MDDKARDDPFLANVCLGKPKMAEDVETGHKLMGNTKMALSISYRVMYHLPNFWHRDELLVLLLLPEETGNVGNTVQLGQKMFGRQHRFLSVGKAQDTRFEMTT